MDPEIQLLCVEDKFVSFLRVDWKEEVEEKGKKTKKTMMFFVVAVRL